MKPPHEAAIPNPALKPYEVLIGRWTTVGHHHLMPGITLHGRTTFEWIEGGAFLVMRSEIDEPGVPTGVAIIGSDDALGEQYMLYFDERGVSRHCDVSMGDGEWKWWRDAPGFSQRYTFRFAEGNRVMIGKGELSRDGTTWEPDLELTYTRAAD